MDHSVNTDHSFNKAKDSYSHLEIKHPSSNQYLSLPKMVSSNELHTPRNLERSEATLNLPYITKPIKTITNFGKQASSTRLLTKTSNYKTTPREEAMGTTFGLSKASLLGTRQSDFFADLENDKEMLGRFRQSQLGREDYSQGSQMEKTSRLDAILERTRNMGSKIHLKCFTGRNKDLLLKATKAEDLELVREEMRMQNAKDLKNLEAKSNELTKELDVTVNNVSKKQKVLKKLEDTYERLLKEREDTIYHAEKDPVHLETKLENLEVQLKDLKNSEERMMRIIEICEMNKCQNDEWLRQLSFYSENLNKCIEDQNIQAKNYNKKSKIAEERMSEVTNHGRENLTTNIKLLAKLRQIESENRVIQSHFQSTNEYIRSSVANIRRNMEETVTDKIKQIEEAAKDEDIATKNREIRTELDKLRNSLEPYKELFEPGADGSSWLEKKEMKGLIETFAERKELEKELMQRRFDLKDLQIKKSDTKRRLEV
jgi:hypothetical protein